MQPKNVTDAKKTSDESFGARLKTVRKARSMTQQDMAEHLAISKGYVWQLEDGRKQPSPELIHSLEVMERMPILDPPKKRGDVMYNVEIIPLPRQIPILSYAQMGALTSYEELPYEHQKTFPTDVEDPKAFALTLRGDSMEPDYKEGSIAILRPSSEPQLHQPAVARFNDGSVVFKIYTREKDQIILRSINPDYDPIRVDAKDVTWVYPVDSVHRILWK